MTQHTNKYIIIILVFLILTVPGWAANYTVSPSGSGSENGSDWDNTIGWDTISFSRGTGNTYYLMEGSYSGKTLSTAVSGSYVITIKKCGTGDGTCENISGYTSSEHDGQAVFTSGLTWTTNYWVFDGATRNENDWSDSTAYGFYVDGGTNGNGYKLFNVTSVGNITIQYVYAAYDSVLGGSDISANQNHGLYSSNGSTNITMEYCFIKNTSWKAAILINSSTGPFVVRYNRFENIDKKELWSARATDNVTFAYNYCKNIAGTGAIVSDDSDNWSIYGNVFWNPNVSYTFSDVTIGTWTGDHPDRTETLNNWKIYNNTFYDVHDQIQIQKGTGNEVRNTLVIGETISINGSLTASNNTQNASTSVIENSTSGDFHLVSDGAAGTGYTLSSTYNQDMDGVTRGSSGVWDIGAFEYSTGGDVTDPVVTISNNDPEGIGSDSLYISGTATDAVGVTECKYRIGSAPDESNGTTITGTTTWSGTATGFSEGDNTLYVGCDDAANNWGVDSIVVNLAPANAIQGVNIN